MQSLQQLQHIREPPPARDDLLEVRAGGLCYARVGDLCDARDRRGVLTWREVLRELDTKH